jgi:hypothetical protein
MAAAVVAEEAVVESGAMVPVEIASDGGRRWVYSLSARGENWEAILQVQFTGPDDPRKK